MAMTMLIVAVMMTSFAPLSGTLTAQEATPATPASDVASDAALGYDPELDRAAALDEVTALLAAEGYDDRALAAEQRDRETRFTDTENVFLPSTIALDDLENPELASAVVPLFLGVGTDGVADEEYIITEASDFDIAHVLGVNYAPKLVHARGTGGEQEVTVEDGRIVFRGSVDFGPELSVEAGPAGQNVVPGTSVFPPAAVQPGAVGDAEWSSAVVLPSGLVINAQIVANGTGVHDRVVEISPEERQVRLELLDGFQGGDQLYYHFVTDSSDMVAATLERAVYAPRLANLAAFGASTLDDESSLLGFSPNINGLEGLEDPERQGLNYTIASEGQDPINIFPLDPDNDQRFDNNYSPMWDAHVNQWTQEAIDAGLQRRITGFADLQSLIDQGHVESGAISPDGPGNAYVNGLRPSGIIINCPVIAQPFEVNENDSDSDPLG
ncbi:MAG: hypothetical protein AVDCRST_MAG33-2391 [uncultured Thermomicrobiales bacterium]|uniref:Uncharacterized protein n=1 Tax=uncultured Thermomicrobiales bacterium TaxID=1645740 RepID=A0A6J4V630_9BACT|nr:MAG: hypothetical protein AVDCRST_MAG33-2391 [uncultured Thermomicrobiales bacterium]